MTSVLQTTAGKMIFGRYEERRGELQHHPREERNDREPRTDRAPGPERPAPTEFLTSNSGRRLNHPNSERSLAHFRRLIPNFFRVK